MKWSLFFLCVVICSFFSCKKGHVADISGTIGGIPATTLYGDPTKYADYILLSMDSSRIAYSGNIYRFYHFSNSTTRVFIRDSVTPVAQADITITGTKVTMIFDTVYKPYSFGSKQYTSD